MKLNHPINKHRLDPKQAVPEEILEQYPWHWDPQFKNHNDDSYYLENVEFDWKGLADWCIDKCNQHLTPEKYWWYDYENESVMHANENVNNMPIYQQALLALKNNTHNQHNSQYFKIANEEFEHWFEPLKELFPEFGKDKLGISLFIQPPGHTIWSHVDTYSSFIRRTGDEKPDYSSLRRYMVFVRDWDWGHFFHMGNAQLGGWQAGDLYSITPGVFHGSANAGLSPKITIHWSGELK
jgi:hypothetical protein